MPLTADVSPRDAIASRGTTVALVVVLFGAVICWWPLTGYFLAQDDLVLLHKAAFHPDNAITDFFGDQPGHFRPLTKGAYFVAMFRLFGLNAMAYHIVSLLVHLFNVWWLFVLLRRLRVGELASLAAVAAFALHAAFFHVIAWASCIQQLAGMALALLCIERGIAAIDGIGTGVSRARWVSLAAYAAAIGCVEQTMLVPFVFPLYVWMRARELPSLREGLARMLRVTTEHWALLVAFGLFVGLWKGAPKEGTYAFSLGENVVTNLGVYGGWIYHYAMRLPMEISVEAITWQPGHALLVAILAFLLVRRRYREIAFGIGTVVLLLLPGLFLSGHQFLLHTYIPAVGSTFLLASALDEVSRMNRVASRRWFPSIVAVWIIAALCVGWHTVRVNERLKFQDESSFQRSFVLRRATCAQNTYATLQSRRKSGAVDRVILVYGRPGSPDGAQWRQSNVIEALGRGAAIQLFYGVPNLEIIFATRETISELDIHNADVFFFDDSGSLRLPSETSF